MAHEEATPRPDGLTEEYLVYLDDLRDTGVTNMFAAAPYLAEDFDLDIEVARTYLSYWMRTFSERRRSA